MRVLPVDHIRVGLVLLVLFGHFCLQVFAKHFFAPQTEVPFLVACSIVFLVRVIFEYFPLLSAKGKLTDLVVYFFDALFFVFCFFLYPSSIAIFVLMLLVNILLCGMSRGPQAAFSVSVFSSIFFSVALILSGDIEGQPFLFALLFNNFIFFMVAFVAGGLSDVVADLGYELEGSRVELDKLSSLIQVAFDSLPQGIVVTDLNYRVQQVNSSFFKVASFATGNSQSIVGLRLPEILPWLANILEVNRPEVEVRPNLQGEGVVSIVKAQLKEPSEGLVFVMSDRTEVRSLEKKIQQSEKLAAVGQLAAGIAHEIRNPLASISGSVQMLNGPLEQKDSERLRSIIVKETARLSELIEEFLEYVRPDKPLSDSISLSDLLRDTLEVVKMNPAFRADVELKVHIAAEIRILGDSNKLKQALLNILLNGLQAMNDTSKKHSLEIELLRETALPRATLRISDTGSGMTDETKSRLFEPFYTTKSKGTGLGLAVTYKILQNHNAEVIVSSSVGQGTTFQLLFDLSAH